MILMSFDFAFFLFVIKFNIINSFPKPYALIPTNYQALIKHPLSKSSIPLFFEISSGTPNDSNEKTSKRRIGNIVASALFGITLALPQHVSPANSISITDIFPIQHSTVAVLKGTKLSSTSTFPSTLPKSNLWLSKQPISSVLKSLAESSLTTSVNNIERLHQKRNVKFPTPRSALALLKEARTFKPSSSTKYPSTRSHSSLWLSKQPLSSTIKSLAEKSFTTAKKNFNTVFERSHNKRNVIFPTSHSALALLKDAIAYKPSSSTKYPSAWSHSSLWLSKQPITSAIKSLTESSSTSATNSINTAFERSRQKRNVAIKAMENKGILKVETDDSGNQFLSLPWIPDKKVPYKRLPLQQRLFNEVCAGAFGEFCKDIILHPVDTLKTRRQAQKKKQASEETIPGNDANSNGRKSFDIKNMLMSFKELYSGFPVVMCASIPQGATFFLFKKGLLEYFGHSLNPSFLESIVSSSAGTSGYWGFRTPAEIIKTQVQTGQCRTVMESLESIKKDNNNNLGVLWKYYPVMLTLDIPFQVLNFILYGIASDTLLHAGFETSTWTRLVCGMASGMFCAGVTCPIDVCKTRIIARDKENIQKLKLFLGSRSNATLITSAIKVSRNASAVQMGSLLIPKLKQLRFPTLNSVRARTNLTPGAAVIDVESLTTAEETAAEVTQSLYYPVVVEDHYDNDDNGEELEYTFARPRTGTLSFESDDYAVSYVGHNESFVNASMSPVMAAVDQGDQGEQQSDHTRELGIRVTSGSIPIMSDGSSGSSGGSGNSDSTLSDLDLTPSLAFKRPPELNTNSNVWIEMNKIVTEEGFSTLFLGLKQRLIYTGLANGIRLAAYGTSRMDLMMKSLDDL